MDNVKNIAVIGGGAAGFFAALSVKQHHPNASVTIFEKTSKVLAKVKVSGGGRCNVTHNETNIKKLVLNYPRGEKFLRKTFGQFSVQDTIKWFKERGVALKVEADNRMFPESNISQTIIDTLYQEVHKLGVQIKLKETFVGITEVKNGLELIFANNKSEVFTEVIIALGGQKKIEKYEVFKELGHSIETPVPSLFTFNISDKITSLMGTSVPNAHVRIQGSKLHNHGPLLITHWGMSGPAILKLSSLAARELADCNYNFSIQVNWLGDKKEDQLRGEFADFISQNGKKLINKNPFDIPNKLWLHFIIELGVDSSNTWSSLDKKSKNRIINKLMNDEYSVTQKTTFKEEFVICGGIALSDVDPHTMQSKITKGLYFAGEYIDIDGVTGGFNFQAAWSTGFVAGKLG